MTAKSTRGRTEPALGRLREGITARGRVDQQFRASRQPAYVDAFQAHLRKLNIAIPVDRELLAGAASPLGQPMRSQRLSIGNRFAIQPMEGWDGTPDGRPSELTFRRWRKFRPQRRQVDLGRRSRRRPP